MLGDHFCKGHLNYSAATLFLADDPNGFEFIQLNQNSSLSSLPVLRLVRFHLAILRIAVAQKALGAHYAASTASKSSSKLQTCPAIPAIIAAVGRSLPLLPGIRVCQQKL